jgi:hypothetical protein
VLNVTGDLAAAALVSDRANTVELSEDFLTIARD